MFLIAPGFPEEKRNIAMMLSRIMFISPILLGISNVFGGVLQSFKRFFVYSLSPIFYNIGIIIGALYLSPVMGPTGLAWGVVLGAALHLLVQVPLIFHLGFRYSPKIDFKDKNILAIGRMMVPRTMSLAISNIDLLVSTSVASTLAAGSLAIFNLANNLQWFPVGIFGMSFAVAAFPALSASKTDKDLGANFSATARNILFFIIPSVVLMFVLRAQIVRVLLGTGRFSWDATVWTIDTLGYFCIGIGAQALIPLLVRVFYARHNSKTPFYIGMFSVLVDIVLCLTLPRMITCEAVVGKAPLCTPMGVEGIALAFSISSLVNLFMLWYALYKKVGHLDGKRILNSTWKFFLASAIAGAAAQFFKTETGKAVIMEKFLGVLIQGAIAGVIGILAYILVCYLLKSEELFVFWNSFRRRLPWNKVESDDQGEARGI
jgi:putative peptidoglycan lipid II flippase